MGHPGLLASSGQLLGLGHHGQLGHEGFAT